MEGKDGNVGEGEQGRKYRGFFIGFGGWTPLATDQAIIFRSEAPTPQGTGTRAPTFTNGWARGHREQKNSKQETDHNSMTTTKALTNTTIVVVAEPKK